MVDIREQEPGKELRLAFLIRMPSSLLKQVDDRAKAKGMSRNEWFVNMTKFALEYQKNREGKR